MASLVDVDPKEDLTCDSRSRKSRLIRRIQRMCCDGHRPCKIDQSMSCTYMPKSFTGALVTLKSVLYSRVQVPRFTNAEEYPYSAPLFRLKRFSRSCFLPFAFSLLRLVVIGLAVCAAPPKGLPFLPLIFLFFSLIANSALTLF